MMAFQYFLYFLLISGSVHSLSLSAYEKIIEEAKAYPITLDREYIADDETKEGRKPKPRGGISDPKVRWHDYRLFIVVDTAYTKEEREHIAGALFTLGKAMQCFKFILVNRNQKVNLRKDHLYIKKGPPSDCFANIGRLGIGRQVAEIGEKCGLYGTVLHEVMHVLGFFHEHVRQDRDNYVKVHEEQFKPPAPDWIRSQFEIRYNQILYAPYDFDSIMHYPMNNPYMSPLLGKVPPGVTPGQKDHLSKGDIERLTQMYPCANAPGR